MNRAIPKQQLAGKTCTLLAKWTLATALLGSMLFAHGCHGDEDHELLTRAAAWLTDESK
jgi:hypothetical protein